MKTLAKVALITFAALSLLGCGNPFREDELQVRWEGSTDYNMLKQARGDLELAVALKAKKLNVTITSGGGPVLTSLEIARLVRDTSEKTGLVVEIHATALCASGCTFVLASGTPGHRYISQWALFVVHSMQMSAGFMEAPTCVSYITDPKTQDDKATDVVLRLMRDSYTRYTKADPDTVEKWITCGNEQVGRGDLALRMGFVDQVE